MISDNEPGMMWLGEMGATDNDGYWLVDATDNMTNRKTTIATIVALSPVRLDGQPLSAIDIAVSAATVAVSGLQWTFKVVANGGIGTYVVGFRLTLTNSDVITRYGELLVKPLY